MEMIKLIGDFMRKWIKTRWDSSGRGLSEECCRDAVVLQGSVRKECKRKCRQSTLLWRSDGRNRQNCPWLTGNPFCHSHLHGPELRLRSPKLLHIYFDLDRSLQAWSEETTERTNDACEERKQHEVGLELRDTKRTKANLVEHCSLAVGQGKRNKIQLSAWTSNSWNAL